MDHKSLAVVGKFTMLAAFGSLAPAIAVAQSAPAQQALEIWVGCTSRGLPGSLWNTDCSGQAFDAQLDGTDGYFGLLIEAMYGAPYGVPGWATDAYDGFGLLLGVPDGALPATSSFIHYDTDFNGLSGTRRTELYMNNAGLPQNSARFYDSFTNNTGSTIQFRLGFGGNLGSDGNTTLEAQGAFYYITSDNNTSSDPIIAHVYGNNEFAEAATVTVGNDSFVVFPEVSVAPGETIAYMNLELLFASVDRVGHTDEAFEADVLEAIAASELYVNSPVFAGLTAQEISVLLNWGDIQGLDPVVTNTGGAWGSTLQGMTSIAQNFIFAPPTLKGGGAGVTRFGSSDGLDPYRFSSKGSSSVTPYAMYVLGGGSLGSISGGSFNATYFGAGASVFLDDVTVGASILKSQGASGSGISSWESGYTGVIHAEYDAGWGWLGRAAFGYGRYAAGYNRTAGAMTATGQTNADAFTGGAFLGYRFDMQGHEIMPYASATYSSARFDAYSETGAGAGNLSFAEFWQSGTIFEAGVRAATDMGPARVYGGLGYAYRLAGNGTTTTAFTTGGATGTSQLAGFGAGSQAVIEVGIESFLTDNIEGSIGYKGYVGADQIHSLNAALSITF